MNYVRSPVFWYGVVAAVLATYAYHHFVKQLPGTNRNPASTRKNGNGG